MPFKVRLAIGTDHINFADIHRGGYICGLVKVDKGRGQFLSHFCRCLVIYG